MQTIKLMAGMTNEYEIIKTDAPINLINQQLRQNNELQESLKAGYFDPYLLLTESGYEVEIIGCQDDFDQQEIEIDIELDYYNYQ